MRWFGVIVFSTLSLGSLLYALLSVVGFLRSIASDGSPATGFAMGFILPLLTLPFAVLVGIPVVFALLFAALRRRRK
ncbi:MAG: hypothetical protein ACOX9C_03375 [Kiritimatiellia bacterium]|jgi:hypothetical protein